MQSKIKIDQAQYYQYVSILFFIFCRYSGYRQVGAFVIDIAFVAVGLEFEFRAGLIGH